VSDVNFPDGTIVLPGTAFTKKWVLKNTGSCTWTSSYKLIFDHGDQMSAPDWVKLTSGTVLPGETVEAGVDLVAPSASGTYQGEFKLRSSDGSTFGIGASGDGTFYVQIVVKPVLALTLRPLNPPLTIARPDLTITSYSIDPATPQKNVPATISITVKNEGTANAGTFTVRWYQSDSAPIDCAWAVPSLAKGASTDLDCIYSFPSFYSNIRTRATVDDDEQITESDETNNVAYKNINVTN
jgi:hypothetical protein